MVCRIKHRKVVLDSNKRFNRCEKKCPHLYKEKYSLHWGHHCVPMVIPRGCLDEQCMRCQEGYYWLSYSNQRSSCEEVCPSGYFGNSLKVCQKCGIKDCQRCSDTWFCEKCNEGKLLYKTIMGSVVCISKCPSSKTILMTVNGEKRCVRKPTTIKPTTTTATAPAAFLIDNVALIPAANPPSGCVDVSCMNCMPGYFNYVFATGGRACVENCPKGQVDVQGLCVSCYDRRCSKCDSSLSECFDCFPGYAKILTFHGKSTECVIECPLKYKEVITNGERTCIKDSATDCEVLNCGKCAEQESKLDQMKCMECLDDFVLFQGSSVDHCYRTCPPGYDTKNENGVAICTEMLPTGCLDKQCFGCKKGYFSYLLATGAKTCVIQCPKGFTDIQGLCVACYDHRCSKCDDTLSECKTCFPGYAKVLGAHNITTECAIECPDMFAEKIINGTRICEKTSQSVCPILNCDKCVNGISKDLRIGCLECRKGFVLFRDPIADHCYRNCPAGFDETIHPENNSTICTPILPPTCMDKECLKCKEGYVSYFLATGGRACMEQCPDGYTPIKGLCVACSDRRCKKCENSLSECQQCFPGYFQVLGAYNSSTECVVECPYKFKEARINNTNICFKETNSECPVSNCKTCIDGNLDKIHFGCSECADGFVLYRGAFADRCYKNCPPGFYPTDNPQTGIRTCVECESPFCSKCTDSKKCLKCHEPLLLDRYTNRCRTCPALTNYDFKFKRCVNLGSQFYGGNVIVK